MTSHRFTPGTELGLPEGVCLRCATLQTPEPSTCERPRPPTLLWRDSNGLSRLLVDGHIVSSVSYYDNGLWRWETEAFILLGRLSTRRGEFKANLDDCKRDCEAFVRKNLDIEALERLRERIGAS